MLNREKSYVYKGWVMALYNDPAGLLFHDCEDGSLGMTAAQVQSIKTSPNTDHTFTAVCLHCKAKMPVEYSQVLVAMWNLYRKTLCQT